MGGKRELFRSVMGVDEDFILAVADRVGLMLVVGCVEHIS